MRQPGDTQPGGDGAFQITKETDADRPLAAPRPPLPSGTLTFLFTDIEGSTRLWERFPEAMRSALAHHDKLLQAAIERHNGYVFKTVGDAFCAAFPTAPDALRAALEAHLALLAPEWGETGPIRVRMGLHTGEAEERNNDYFGQTLNRVARLQGIGHGQQTLISQASYELIANHLPADTMLADMGMHRLKDLAAPEHVWQLKHPSLPQEFPALKSLDYLLTNLPAQMTSFIGREKEIAEIKERLTKTRLLTLTGSGGSGKTRLSLQVGADLVEEYREGVWFVELAPLADPALVPQTVAEALGVREAPGEAITKTLLSALKDRQLLLILDNCEHLLEASDRLVDALLRGCPHLRVLVSSREALGVAGESSYRIPSLSLPNPAQTYTPDDLTQYEAIRLFIERAVAAQADFRVTHRNAQSLVSICHRLDGIPLAIELAAARVRAMPIEEINTRLDNRFRLLTGGRRTALPRQQTLKALIDWSYDLLKEQERTLLCRLSVFMGGWTLAATEQVCIGGEIEEWEVLDLLTSLVDKSLVGYEDREGTARYRLLETVRQYAREKLMETGEVETVRTRHQGYFLALAEQAEPMLEGADQAKWLQRLEEEHENLRMALEWSLLEEKESFPMLRFCGALQRFWSVRGHLSEGREWCARALGMVGVQEWRREQAKVLHAAGLLAQEQGDYAFARTCHEESLTIRREMGDRRGIAASLNNLGVAALDQGEYAFARTCHEESLTIRREIGDQGGIAASLNNLANLANYQGDYASARAYLEESLAIWRWIGNQRGIAVSLINLGIMSSSQGDYVSAQAYYAESLAIRREIGDQNGIAICLNNLGTIAHAQGDYVSAHAYFQESLAIRRDIGDQNGIASSFHNLGYTAKDQGDYVSAQAYFEESLAIRKQIGAQRGIAESLQAFADIMVKSERLEHATALWGAAEVLRERISTPLSPADKEEFDRDVAAARQALGEEVFMAAWAKGQAMTLEQASAYALEAVV